MKLYKLTLVCLSVVLFVDGFTCKVKHTTDALLPEGVNLKPKTLSRFLRLYKQSKRKFRKLQLKIKKEEEVMKNPKKMRELISGGQIIGGLGALGGIGAYAMSGGDDYQFQRMAQEERTRQFQIMMKKQQRRVLVKQMTTNMNEMEQRLDDLGEQVSSKIQEYNASLRRFH